MVVGGRWSVVGGRWSVQRAILQSPQNNQMPYTRPHKRCKTAHNILLMSTMAIMSRYSDATTPKRRRTKYENTAEAYTHSFEEMYCADALLLLTK